MWYRRLLGARRLALVVFRCDDWLQSFCLGLSAQMLLFWVIHKQPKPELGSELSYLFIEALRSH